MKVQPSNEWKSVEKYLDNDGKKGPLEYLNSILSFARAKVKKQLNVDEDTIAMVKKKDQKPSKSKHQHSQPSNPILQNPLNLKSLTHRVNSVCENIEARYFKYKEYVAKEKPPQAKPLGI